MSETVQKEVTVEHLGGVQFEIKARQHSILCDQPPEKKGEDRGMTPPELMLASLASCAAFYAIAYLRKKELPTEGTRVRVTAEQVKAPARLDNFHITVELPPGLGEEHCRGAEDSVHHCLIHNTLLQPPSIALEIQSGAAQSA